MNMQSPQNLESPEEMPPHLELQEVEARIQQIEEELLANDTYYQPQVANYKKEYEDYRHQYGDAVFPININAKLSVQAKAMREYAMTMRPELEDLYKEADNLREKINRSKPS